MLFPTSTILHWAWVGWFVVETDKHRDFSAVAVASWEAIDRAAVVLTNCPGDAGANTNL